MGVNLAGVELILRLLDEMEEQRREMEQQFVEYIAEAEQRIVAMMKNPSAPLRKDESLLPVPNFRARRPMDL
jgi:MerR family transcriptional regulator/heat shock protein HspR